MTDRRDQTPFIVPVLCKASRCFLTRSKRTLYFVLIHVEKITQTLG